MRTSPGKLPSEYWPLFDLPSIKGKVCAVCGRNRPLNDHHLIWRSWAGVQEDGRELEKPTVTLCGTGAVSGCHRKAHERSLHFRNNGGVLEYLERDGKYRELLDEEGWKPCPYWTNDWPEF